MKLELPEKLIVWMRLQEELNENLNKRIMRLEKELLDK
jgi:hypothetical protein